jgi:hypothetical protein
MKKNYILIFILLLSSIGYVSAQTIVSTTPENKNAIVEESTAIHCGACPYGHAILNQVIDQNPNDVFVIKFHEGGYAWDCDPNGGHDFNNTVANQLGTMGAASGQPSASVNRQVFSNWSSTGGTAMSRSYWSSAISQVLQESADVNVGVEAELAGNVLTIHVEAYYTASSPQSTNYLHVAIMQDETVGPQMGGIDFNPSYVVSSSPNSSYAHGEYDYRHMDRLVDMVDGINGDAISTTSAGTFIDRTYTYTLPEMYNDVPVDLAEIEVAAFITDGDEIINGYKVEAAYTPVGYDVAVVSIDSPSGSGVYSDNENIIVTIENFGEYTVSNFDVSYQVNGGDTVTETFTSSLAYEETSQYTFYATYDFSNPGDYEIAANTSLGGDDVPSNDMISNSFTSIAGGDCPDEYSLPIVWRDEFECHTEFSISEIGDWVIHDLEGGTTWGANDVGFTNESYVGAGIIYNHALATDDTATGSLTSFDDWAPYEGNQGLYFFASGANSTPFPNDDWMISPEFTLSGVTSPTFTMWAKSVTAQYGLERFQVGVGNSTDYNDFTIISEGVYIEAPTEWTQYQFDLSQYEGQTIRIAIHYIGNDSFVLQTDSYSVDGTLGIGDSEINNFEYFYNVSTKNLEMTSDETLRKIEIFNILGQKVFQENINSNTHTSSLMDLGTSIYIVNIEGTTGMKSFKLLVQ